MIPTISRLNAYHYIQVNVYVERASQKGIIIGNRGAAIRDLGRTAREKIDLRRFLESLTSPAELQ